MSKEEDSLDKLLRKYPSSTASVGPTPTPEPAEEALVSLMKEQALALALQRAASFNKHRPRNPTKGAGRGGR